MAVISSAYVVSPPISISNTGGWVFVAIQSPTIKATGLRVRQPLSHKIDESMGIFVPLGGSKKVVVSAAVYGDDGDYEIMTTGETEWATLLAILTYQGILFVQDPLGRSKYVRFTQRSWVESGKISNLIRTTKISYVEVSAP